MANQVTIIAQKRATLCKQIQLLTTALSEKVMHDELALLELNQPGMDQMDEIHKNFFAIAVKLGKIQNIDQVDANNSIPGAPMGQSTFIEKQRLLKHPVAELPKSDGDLDKLKYF